LPLTRIRWALLVLNMTHLNADWVDTVVLTQLMFTKHGEEPPLRR